MSIFVDIRKTFDGFSLDMRFESAGSGGPLGVLGASGSGKSMTLKCIAGLETPDEGRIVVNGRVLFDSAAKINLKPQQRRVGYLFQSYALFPNMTVAQNIGCAVRGDKFEKTAKAAALLQLYELDGLGGRYPSELSGGQQQRVALARVMAYEPEVLLLDEPFAALDAWLKDAMQAQMKATLQSYGGDTLLVTHNRDEVYRLCNTLLVVANGGVAAHGGVKEVFQNPGTAEVARLTGCKNISAVERVEESRVHAVDFGVELDVGRPLPADVTHIGIRAHNFVPCAGADGAVRGNAIVARVCEVMEEPFEWSVLFCREEGSGQMWWKIPKGANSLPPEAVVDGRICFCVAPESIMLLHGGTLGRA